MANRLIWQLARECRQDDVVVVGVATPMATAAVLLARELLVPNLTVLLGTAVEPSTHDIAEALVDPAAASRHAVGLYRQADLLDAVSRGRVTLQFVSPAQVDGRGAINASRIPGPDGRRRRLPGGLALADTTALVGRLVAYRAAHSSRFLTDQVTFTTGAARGTGRGAGVTAVVTDTAVIDWAAGTPRLASLSPGAGVSDAVAGCGFPLEFTEPVPISEEPPAEAVALLDEVIDPSRTRLLEIPADRADALDAWQDLL